MKLNWNRVFFLTIAKIIWFSSLLIFGLVVGLIYGDLPNVTLIRVFSLGDLSNLILAIVVAILVPFYLNKKITNRRIEKDLLIDSCHKHEDREIGDLEMLLEKTHLKQTISIDDAKQLISKTKRVSSRLSLLVADITHLSDGGSFRNILDKLELDQINLMKEMTKDLRNTPPIITSDSYTSSVNNIYRYLKHMSELRMLINDV